MPRFSYQPMTLLVVLIAVCGMRGSAWTGATAAQSPHPVSVTPGRSIQGPGSAGGAGDLRFAPLVLDPDLRPAPLPLRSIPGLDTNQPARALRASEVLTSSVRIYLPLVSDSRARMITAIITEGIPFLPVINPTPEPPSPTPQFNGTFYLATMTFNAALPAGGHFYLAADRYGTTPAYVSRIFGLWAGQIYMFLYDFGTTPAFVEIPRGIVQSWSGGGYALRLQRGGGDQTGSTPLYLVWRP